MRTDKLFGACLGHTTTSGARALEKLKCKLLPPGMTSWPRVDANNATTQAACAIRSRSCPILPMEGNAPECAGVLAPSLVAVRVSPPPLAPPLCPFDDPDIVFEEETDYEKF